MRGPDAYLISGTDLVEERKMEKTLVGNLEVQNGKTYDLEKITGNIIFSSRFTAKFPNLTSIGDSVYAGENAKLDLPAVINIGDSVYAEVNSKIDLPAVTSIGGSVYAGENAKLDSAGENAKLDLPYNLKRNDTEARARCRAALYESFKESGYLFVDGILAKIISHRGPVYRVMICGKTKSSYCVTNGVSWSHGETLAKAREGLIYKISSRDKSEFKDWKLDKEVSKADAIKAYRVITGACEQGVRNWMEAHKTPEIITVEGIIRITEGAYGYEEFKKFFARNEA